MRLFWSAPGRRPGPLELVAGLSLLAFLVARFVPVARLPFWGCALREATGLPCPGCGLTRVMERVSQGNLPGAWDANPLGALVAGTLVGAVVASAIRLTFGLPTPSVVLSLRESRLLVGSLALLVTWNYGFQLARAILLGEV